MTDGNAASFAASAVKVDITPADLRGLNPMGQSRTTPQDPDFSGVHSRLHARVLVLRDGLDEVIFVCVDAIEVGDTLSWRQTLGARFGLRADAFFISASHSHNAPRLGHPSPGAMTLPPSHEAERHSIEVFAAIEHAIATARATTAPARISQVTGTTDVAINRDYPRDYGTTDHHVRTLMVEDMDQRVIAILANYAVHPTAMLGTRLLSADIAGEATAFVEGSLPGTVALWTAGTLGDQSPRYARADFTASDAPSTVINAVSAQGSMIGAEIVRLVAQRPAGGNPSSLRTSELVVRMPTRRSGTFNRPFDGEGTVDLRMLVARIGEHRIVGISGEVDCELADHVRRAVPEASDLIIASLVNDRIGYLPHDAAWDRGTFSVGGCPVGRGDGDAAVEHGIRALLRAVA